MSINTRVLPSQGKVPPQAVDLEKIVLGSLLIDKKGIENVIDILNLEAFYTETHKKIYQSIYTLFQNSEPIDLRTVSNQLRKDGNLALIGSDYYLIDLTQQVASTAHIEHHSRIIVQKYIQRKLISISSEIFEESYSDTIDVIDLLNNSEKKIFEITQGNLQKGSDKICLLVEKTLKKIQESSNKNGMSGIPSGFTKLDQLTSGWQASDLIIIAARPGMGKTAFVLSMAKNMAIKLNYSVAIFSLEMSSIQLTMRLVSSETRLSSNKLRKGDLQAHEWESLNVNVKDLTNHISI